MTDIKEEMARNRQELNSTAEGIRNNPKLSPEGRRDAIQQVYNRALEQHRALKEHYDAAVEREREDLHSQLFAPSFAIGQPDYVRANIRSEYQRNLQEADRILFPDGAEEYDVEGLLRYLEMAELSGDQLASKAAFAVASNKGVTPVVNAYLESRPELAEKYEQHKALEQATREPTALQRIAQGFELSPPVKPEEIRDYQPSGTSSAMAEIFGGASGGR
jgi:hypothetical protein